MSIAPGTRLGSYEIVSTLGSGGMGEVYRAYDSRLQRTVAIKILSDEAERRYGPLLLHEARAASGLSHPHICVVYEVGEADGRTFIAMEYVDGKPLSELIPVNGLPADNVMRYGAQIADALTHAHDRGVIHRDLKSSNIIVTKDGLAKVVDFGLARRMTMASPDMPTSSNVVDASTGMAGTLGYMAPEVLRGEPATVSSDLWGLGVLLYEMSAGRLPFTGRTAFELTSAILQGAVPPLPASVPSGVRGIIALCLAREAGERYRSAGEVRAALQAVRSDSTSVVPDLAEPRRAAQSTATWSVAAALLLVGVVAAAFFLRGAFTRDATPPAQSATGRLTLLEGTDRRAFDPALSPDGKMIAYVAEDESGRLDLYAGRVAGGGRLRLTSDSGTEEHPRFSPDGERILFNRRRADALGAELCIVPALGGDVSVVLSNAVQGVWSPDGSRIAFVHIDPAGKAIALMTTKVDGSEPRTVLAADGVHPSLRNPAWSPDGKTIAIVRGTGGVAGEIWLISSEGGDLRRLSNDRAAAVFSDEPEFTTDGRAVLHASNRGGATNIWSQPLDGGAPVRLTTGPGPEISPTTAVSGAVAFASSRWRSALYLYDVAGKNTRTLTTHSAYLWGPTFSPSGSEVAISRSEVDGAWHLWLASVEGTAVRQLTSGPQGEVYPRYTPDGAFVIYHTWDRPRRVWKIARQGGRPVALTPENLDATFADLSPDGTSLAFVVTENNSLEQVYTMRLPDGMPTLLTKTAASTPRWSPDGKWIAFSPDRSYSGGVFVIRPDGTDERRMTQTGGWPVWWPNSQRIGYRIVTPDARQQIESVALDGKAAGSIDFRFQGNNDPFDVSPDARSLAVTNHSHVSDEIWLIHSPK